MQGGEREKTFRAGQRVTLPRWRTMKISAILLIIVLATPLLVKKYLTRKGKTK